jgi:hypothetical protein
MKKRLSPGRRLLKVLLAILLLGSSYCYCQTPQSMNFLDWDANTGSQNFFQKNISKTDGSGNVYVCGATINGSGDYDLLVAKYNSSGVQQWINQYAGAAGGNDFATAMWIDGSSNVYVTGSTLNSAVDSNDVVTIKYNSSGTQQWAVLYNGGYGNDGGSDITVDGSGNVYISGMTNTGTSTYFDGLLVKYNSSGTQQYVKTFDNANLNDGAYRVALLTSNRVAIACIVQATATTFKFASVRYTATTGAFIASTISASSSIGFKMVTGCVTDAAHNMYVTGWEYNLSTGFDYRTIKLDSALTQIWSASFDGASHLDDQSNGIAMDGSGNVYVTGFSTSANGKDYTTIKYNSSGTQQWVEYYNDPNNDEDVANAIVLDNNGLPVVTGYHFNGSSKDYHTIKYGVSGTVIWSSNYNGLNNKDDRAFDIACDANNDIIVTGQTQTASLALEYTTVKYSERTFTEPNLNNEPKAPAFCFIQNRGQLLKTNNSAASDVLYYNRDGSTQEQLFFKADKMSYVFSKYDTATTSPSDTLIRVDVANKNSNANCKLGAYDERPDYLSFFLGQLGSNYPTRIKTYNNLVYKNIYTGIDKVISSNMSGMKYFYVVNHGISTTQLQEEYIGADSVVLSGTELKIKTKLGTLTYKQPLAWQIDGSGNYISLAWQPTYNLTGPVVSFSLGSYDTSKILVIMMYKDTVNPFSSPNPSDNLDWLTHDAGGLNTGTIMNCVKTRNNGESYYSTETSSNAYPVSGGIYTAAAGSYDGVIIKFNANASRDWATYMGGSGYDSRYRFAIDTIGNVYFLGRTNSTDLIPVGPLNSFQQSSNGGSNDWHIGKLDSSGTQLPWSTYYGGNGNDRAESIWVNAIGTKIYAVGLTSSTNFPLCNKSHAYNSTTGWGTIVRFDQLDTTWATQFGTGSELYGLKDVCGLSGGGVVVVGACNGPSDIPTMNNGTYFDNSATTDAFISAFNPSDTLYWSTGFGATVFSSDFANAVYATTKNIYVVGMTSATSSFPLLATGSEYSDPICMQQDGFIARFTYGGAEKWCTYYGGVDNEDLTGCVVDTADNLYVCGYTRSWNMTTQTNGSAYVEPLNGSFEDGIIGVFNDQNQRIWATCLGGNESENMQCLAVSEAGYLYVGGYSNSVATSFPWDYPVGAWIDISKNTTTHSAAYEGRFALSSINFVGINENNAEENHVRVFPNPSSSSITIELEKTLNESELQINIYDISGRLLKSEQSLLAGNNLQYTVDISTFSTGVYMIEIIGDEKSLARCKFVKQ